MIRFSVFLCGAAFLASNALAADIHIEDAASHAMVPSAKVGDGYMSIVNDGSTADRLISATSDRARSVDIHRMAIANGIMTMQAVKDGLAVPPHSTLTLAPNYHLMFNDVQQPFKKGETVKATLVFEKAGPIEVNFRVGNIAGPLTGDKDTSSESNGMAGMSMSNMAMSKMDMGAMQPATMQMAPMNMASDPEADIGHTLKAMFETPDKPLTVDPVTIEGNWAVAGRQQGGRGGRVLFARTDLGWQPRVCGGDALRDKQGLIAAGMSAPDAQSLASHVQHVEASLDTKTIASFDSFEGTVVLSAEAAPAAHAGHEGHGK